MTAPRGPYAPNGPDPALYLNPVPLARERHARTASCPTCGAPPGHGHPCVTPTGWTTLAHARRRQAADRTPPTTPGTLRTRPR